MTEADMPYLIRDKPIRSAGALLFVTYYEASGVPSVREITEMIRQRSSYTVHVLNLFEHRIDTGHLKVPPSIDFDAFDVIVIHNPVSYNVDNLYSLDAVSPRRLADYAGVKVLFRQDENFRHREVAEYIGLTGFDIVFTCLPESERAKIYPPSLVGDLRFVQMLTSYVTPDLRSMDMRNVPRQIDIGYRGSIQPLSFGRMTWEKRKIGDDVYRLLADRRLMLDISSRWEDRIGGDGWLRFLASCKATLGTESGGSIFDLNGDLAERCRANENALGPYRDDEDYAEAYLAGLGDIEGNVRYAQIGPRHFEAAACRTLQLLYPGDYSGIFVPGRHYFALDRNYSNLDEAIDLLCDPLLRQAITDAAYEEIILNPQYWIETFVDVFDQEIGKAIAEQGIPIPGNRRHAAIERNVLLLVAHEPPRDPRCAWFAKAAPPGILIHQLGISRTPNDPPSSVRMPRKQMVWTYPRIETDTIIGMLQQLLSLGRHSVGLSELQSFFSAATMPDAGLALALKVRADHPRLPLIRNYLLHIVNTSLSMVHHATALHGIHAVIACDLDSLLAALVLKELYDIPVIYDAHEFWAEADVEQDEVERQFWMALERRLLPSVDHAQTVSSSLAAVMTEEYGIKFSCVPNAEPLGSALPREALRHPEDDATTEECHFLFQGGFAKARGLDLLIKAWPRTTPGAVLELRGPYNLYKSEMIRLAKSSGLLGTRILFPDAVSEGEMIQAAAAADVGLIPYTPTGANYSNCCPNKLSQYMAAGLPIMANRTAFVESIIAEASCGDVVDFEDGAALVDAIDRMTHNVKYRREMGLRAHEFFCRSFHWESVSRNFYSMLQVLVGGQEPAYLEQDKSGGLVFHGLWPKGAKHFYRPPRVQEVARLIWRRIPSDMRQSGVLLAIRRFLLKR